MRNYLDLIEILDTHRVIKLKEIAARFSAADCGVMCAKTITDSIETQEFVRLLRAQNHEFIIRCLDSHK